MSYLEKLINKLYGTYLFLFVFFFLVRTDYFPNVYNSFMQLFMLGFSYLLIRLSLHKNTMWLSIFIFQIVSSILMRLFNFEMSGSWLGSEAVDAEFYHSLGNQTDSMILSSFIQYMVLNDMNVDDFGFPIIVYISNRIFGCFSIHALLILNSISILIGSIYLYKLSLRFVDRYSSKVMTLFWGMMPFSVYTSAAGLKENFFALFIILSFYWLYQFYDYRNLRNFLLFFIFNMIFFLFRLAVGYMLFLSFLFYVILKWEIVRKKLYIILFITIILGLFVFKDLASIIMEQRGYEYDNLFSHSTEKLSDAGGSIAVITNLISGFIGPIPSFVSNDYFKIIYITRYSFSTFVKMFISFFYLYSIFLFLKLKVIYLTPMIVFTLLNILMIEITFFTLHDRYHWPHLPLLFVLSMYGFEYYRKFKVGKLYACYSYIVVLLIVLFNFR